MRNQSMAAGALLALALAVGPAAAAPPQNAKPLSQIVAGIEGVSGFASIKEVEWDNDGYWEIEYLKADGSRVEVKIDPVTGSPRK
ncbi:PepSY domain-containing protein [Bosea sp. WAO]|uniref:PepSY domain-containing protein n=1 Tax=Bosea sp. WAO TaxID=406341 RepID=UPI000B2AA95C|nr:PepSY domain-containing protein [Bosea sp. WAO]